MNGIIPGVATARPGGHRLSTRLAGALVHGVVSGSAICFGGLLLLRVNPLFAVQDLPDEMAREVLSLTFLREIDGYDIVLVLVLMAPLLIVLIGDLVRRQTAPSLPVVGGAWSAATRFYLVGLVWFLTVFLVDLVVLDWGFYATLHLPVLGIEHLVSPDALAEFQSYGFHAEEHFAHPNSYLALLITPAALAAVLLGADRVRRRGRPG